MKIKFRPCGAYRLYIYISEPICGSIEKLFNAPGYPVLQGFVYRGNI